MALLTSKSVLGVRIRPDPNSSILPDPDQYSESGSATLYFALPSMGCKAQMIGIIHKILLFMIDHLGRCKLYQINLSSYSILKLTGMDE